jgi:outer membrane protein assembly factor BamB
VPSRRRFLTAAGSVAGAAVAGCLDASDGPDRAASTAGDRTDWPTAGHDRANTNYVPDAPSVRGVARAGRVESGLNATQPVVVDGVLYHVADGLLAVDVESGEERWRLAPEDGQGNFWAAPTVHDGTVYLANGHRRVHAVDAATGETRWTTEVDVGARASPTLGHDGEALFVGGNGHVSRLAAATGEVEWRREVFGQVVRPVALRPPLVYAVTEGGELYAFGEFGDGYWRVDLPAKCGTAPTVVDDRVYLGTFDGRVHAVDGDRAALAWSTEVGGFAKGGVAVADGTVYADGGRELHALDADTGERRWAFDVGATGDHTPVVAGDTVYTTGDRLYALKPGGGLSDGAVRSDAVRFTHRTGGYAGPMSVADGRLFVTGRTGDAEGNQTTVLFVLDPA